MELRNAKKDENEKTLEASVADTAKILEASENDKDTGKDKGVVVEAEAEKNDNEVGETSAGDDEKFVEEASKVPSVLASVEEKKTEDDALEQPSVLASVEASSSGMIKPDGLVAKKKIVKKVKKIVRKKFLKGAPVQVVGEVNVTAEPCLGETKEVSNSPQCSPGSLGEDDMESKKELEEFAEAPADDDLKVSGAEPSGEKTLREVKGKASVLKAVGKRLLKGKKDKGTLATTSQEPKEGDSGASQMEQNDQDRINSLAVIEHSNGIEKSNALEVNTSEGVQQRNEDKTGLAGGRRRKRRRGGKQVLDANKKQKNEVVAPADAATQQSIEEGKKQFVDPEKKDRDGIGNVKPAGLIFMCNAKTRPDCFRFSVMGVQEKRKDYVMSIKPGIKLFLYDYDLKLLYGVFQASSAGGMKLERNAFGGSFPAQVRFKVISDCIPLPESQFKKAIKENYNNRNKFKTELTRKQVFKLTKLFRPASLPAQLTHALPVPVPRPTERKRSDNDRYAPGSSRSHQTRTYEWCHNAIHAAPPPRREEPPRDLYLSEREYRTYGLRREEPSQHYPVLPPDSYRDRVPLDSYRPPVDHERLLRHAEMERHDRREVRHLHISERDYRPYDHLTSRREVLSRNSPEPPASVVALEPYRRDQYHRYEYRSPERQPRTYMTSSGRQDDDLYSRYVTPDSLAEYYRSSRSRYPQSELLPSSMTSRYAYSGSLPYSHR